MHSHQDMTPILPEYPERTSNPRGLTALRFIPRAMSMWHDVISESKRHGTAILSQWGEEQPYIPPVSSLFKVASAGELGRKRSTRRRCRRWIPSSEYMEALKLLLRGVLVLGVRGRFSFAECVVRSGDPIWRFVFGRLISPNIPPSSRTFKSIQGDKKAQMFGREITRRGEMRMKESSVEGPVTVSWAGPRRGISCVVKWQRKSLSISILGVKRGLSRWSGHYRGPSSHPLDLGEDNSFIMKIGKPRGRGP